VPLFKIASQSMRDHPGKHALVVAADPSPLLDDHTREIIAEAVAWAVVHALRAHVVDVPHGDAERRAASPLSLATGR